MNEPDEILELFKTITTKADECDELVTISDLADGLKHTMTILEEESGAVKRLKKADEAAFAAAQIEFICSYLASMYVNAKAKTPEEARELMKELKPTKTVKINRRKADA
jgi:hypothetical protein